VFGDVSGGTFEREILCLSFADVTSGVRTGAFAPRAEVSRAQMASFVVRLIDTAAGLATDGSPVAALPRFDGTNRFVGRAGRRRPPRQHQPAGCGRGSCTAGREVPPPTASVRRCR
jgi:hypothetical protein